MIRRYTLAEMGAIWSEQARFEAMLRVELAVARAQAARGLIPAGRARGARDARPRRRRADRGDRADHRPRRHRLRQPGRRDGRGRGPLPPPRPDQQRRRRHRPRAPAPGRRRRLLDDADRLVARHRRPRPRRGRDGDDGPHPLGPCRAHDVRPQARRLGVRGRSRPDAARGGGRRDRHRQDLRPGRDLQPSRARHRGRGARRARTSHVDPVSTQIVQRDRHAALLAAIAILGGSLERFATEIRNLQHTEIGELQEPFAAGQKGSSAMPHKRNPILSERIAGLARLLRGYASTAFEDQPLWHERDISHSSAERVILPDATIVLDYMLVRMTGLVEGLLVRSERMRENIARGLRPARLVERAGRARRARRPVARGRLRDRAARGAAGRRRARPAARPPGGRPGRRPAAVARRSSTPASTTRRSSTTSPRSSPGSTASRPRSPPGAVRARPREGARCCAESYLRSGKVRDLYRLNDGRIAPRRLRPDQRVRRRPADRDPGQGSRPHRPVAVLVRGDRRDRPEPPARHGSRDPRLDLQRRDRGRRPRGPTSGRSTICAAGS